LKNAARKRIEPLTPEVVEVLQSIKTQTEFKGPDDLVFSNAGKPIDEDVMRRRLGKAGKAAGLPWRITWHCFRRYFAFAADRFGMQTEDRKLAMGHASDEMTAHYATTDIERRRPIMCQIPSGLLAPAKPIESTKSVTK